MPGIVSVYRRGITPPLGQKRFERNEVEWVGSGCLIQGLTFGRSGCCARRSQGRSPRVLRRQAAWLMRALAVGGVCRDFCCQVTHT